MRVVRWGLRGRGTQINTKISRIFTEEIMMKNEWIQAIILFMMLYAVLAFGNFGTGFQYVGF